MFRTNHVLPRGVSRSCGVVACQLVRRSARAAGAVVAAHGNTTIERWPEGHFAPAGAPWHWNYELGTLLEGMDAVWYGSANGEYFRYVKKSVDQFVGADGSISTYDESENSLDNVLLGRQLLLLYGVTQDKRYYKAATTLRQQLAQQPKNASGGFWHKKIYPNQMWLDGLYMAEPFYAEYAAEFQEPQDFAEITRQFVLIDQHARDAKDGAAVSRLGRDETTAVGESGNRRFAESSGRAAWAGT